jgi:hypothetical protein
MYWFSVTFYICLQLFLCLPGDEDSAGLFQKLMSLTGPAGGVTDATYTAGMAAIGCGWHEALFDNFALNP